MMIGPLLAFLSLVPCAHAQQPLLFAMVAPDGQYSLSVEPPLAWLEAEVTVRGDDSRDVGPASPGNPVMVQGWTNARGRLWVTIQAATAEGEGITWMMDVDPDLVPVQVPGAVAETDAG